MSTRSTTAVHQRGAASLIVVLVLFFVMALVAAYTNRNLIFEQRTSINQYRSTQSFEAAEAGLEWALAQLNGGRIDSNCLEAGAATSATSFRQRYLNIDVSTGPGAGNVTALTQASAVSTPRRAGCVWSGTGWSCNCPADGDPVLPTSSGTDLAPAFWVSFSTIGVTRPGVVQIIVNGCTRLDSACLSAPALATNVEGVSQVTALAALKNAINMAPAAALTVAGNVPASAAFAAYNTATDRGGITIHASGTITAPFNVKSIPGTPDAASVIAGDGALNPPGPPVDRTFAAVFGAWPTTFRLQPGAVRLTCPVAGCRQAVTDAVAMNPDRVIWIDGDLTLESAGDIGSLPNAADPTVAGPATIIVTGNLLFTAPNVKIYGFVYARHGSWTGAGTVQGAAFSETDLASTAAATLVFDGPILDALRLRSGSFVKVPGGWRDFFQ